jgi:hypothetical protein
VACHLSVTVHRNVVKHRPPVAERTDESKLCGHAGDVTGFVHITNSNQFPSKLQEKRSERNFGITLRATFQENIDLQNILYSAVLLPESSRVKAESARCLLTTVTPHFNSRLRRFTLNRVDTLSEHPP